MDSMMTIKASMGPLGASSFKLGTYESQPKIKQYLSHSVDTICALNPPRDVLDPKSKARGMKI